MIYCVLFFKIRKKGKAKGNNFLSLSQPDYQNSTVLSPCSLHPCLQPTFFLESLPGTMATVLYSTPGCNSEWFCLLCCSTRYGCAFCKSSLSSLKHDEAVTLHRDGISDMKINPCRFHVFHLNRQQSLKDHSCLFFVQIAHPESSSAGKSLYCIDSIDLFYN